MRDVDEVTDRIRQRTKVHALEVKEVDVSLTRAADAGAGGKSAVPK